MNTIICVLLAFTKTVTPHVIKNGEAELTIAKVVYTRDSLRVIMPNDTIAFKVTQINIRCHTEKIVSMSGGGNNVNLILDEIGMRYFSLNNPKQSIIFHRND